MSEPTDTGRRQLRLQSLQLETSSTAPACQAGWQLADEADTAETTGETMED